MSIYLSCLCILLDILTNLSIYPCRFFFLFLYVYISIYVYVLCIYLYIYLVYKFYGQKSIHLYFSICLYLYLYLFLFCFISIYSIFYPSILCYYGHIVWYQIINLYLICIPISLSYLFVNIYLPCLLFIYLQNGVLPIYLFTL